MDPYGYSYEESSSRGYPNTYREEMYPPHYVPPRSYPSYSSPYSHHGYAPSRGHGPSDPYVGYDYGTSGFNDYDPPSPGYYDSFASHPYEHHSVETTSAPDDSFSRLNAKMDALLEKILNNTAGARLDLLSTQVEDLSVRIQVIEDHVFGAPGLNSTREDALEEEESQILLEEPGKLILDEEDVSLDGVLEIFEDVDPPLEETLEPTHSVIDPELPVLFHSPTNVRDDSMPVTLEPLSCTIEMTGITSTCSTDIFIFSEVENGAFVRKSFLPFLVIVDALARFHKNVATRTDRARLYSTIPILPLLENTKAWHDRHFFLDPG